jgi:hypothetical protein
MTRIEIAEPLGEMLQEAVGEKRILPVDWAWVVVGRDSGHYILVKPGDLAVEEQLKEKKRFFVL